jgi:Alpha-tubulin suppressor and related RCC1 domain-containing proteins
MAFDILAYLRTKSLERRIKEVAGITREDVGKMIKDWVIHYFGKYMKRIIIKENSGNTLTDYPILVTVDTQTPISAGKMKPDGGDIIFIDHASENPLPYWIDSGLNTTETKIWVRIPHIPASGTKEIHLYYGGLPRTLKIFEIKKSLFHVLAGSIVLSIDGPLGGRYSYGGYHTCALLEDGRIACWGRNDYGQLGDGSNTHRYTPVIVSSIGTTLPKAVAIGLGGYHTCALLEDGRIACWGGMLMVN